MTGKMIEFDTNVSRAPGYLASRWAAEEWPSTREHADEVLLDVNSQQLVSARRLGRREWKGR